MGGSQFEPYYLHHPVLANRRFPARRQTGRFCWDFRLPNIGDFVSAGGRRFCGDLDALSLRPKIPFPAAGFEREVGGRRKTGLWVLHCHIGIIGPERRSYSGLSPSASNCRLHSEGRSRSRSIPTPRGRRPSTAALIRFGAREAREIVMLTCLALQLPFCFEVSALSGGLVSSSPA